GSDSRDPDVQLDQAGGWRSDTLILMHIPSSSDRAYLVSIPRDLYVPIPQSADAACDSGRRAKTIAAVPRAGLTLAVLTLEYFTNVRIDNVVARVFASFEKVTDALQGVKLNVERDITSINKTYQTLRKGIIHTNFAEAPDWLRQQK